MHPMTKVEDGECIPIPEDDAGVGSPLSSGETRLVPEQASGPKEVMSLEMALVRALKQLGQTSDESHLDQSESRPA
jgi:hypothetical protein